MKGLLTYFTYLLTYLKAVNEKLTYFTYLKAVNERFTYLLCLLDLKAVNEITYLTSKQSMKGLLT